MSFFWDFVHKLETRTREGDQASFYKYLKTMSLEAKRHRFHTFLNTKSPKLDPNIAKGVDQWPKNMLLAYEVIRLSMAIEADAGRD